MTKKTSIQFISRKTVTFKLQVAPTWATSDDVPEVITGLVHLAMPRPLKKAEYSAD